VAGSGSDAGWTRLEVEQRRAQLIEIGTRLFSERSFDDVSIDEIADAAGISKGLLYHYFPSKRHFYTASIDSLARTLVESAIGADAAASPDPLRAGISAYLEYVEAHEAGYVMLMEGGIGFDVEVRAIVDETRAHFVRQILAGIPGGDSPSPALRLAVRGWVGFVEGATLAWLPDRTLPREELLELYARALIAALREAQRLDPALDLPRLG
jgi:AcrR family transcriptional regulator